MERGTAGVHGPDRVVVGQPGTVDDAVGGAASRPRAGLAARVRAARERADALSRELAAILSDIDDGQDVMDMIVDREAKP